jgi:hypothetical protein
MIGSGRKRGNYKIQILMQVVNKGEKCIDITTSLNDAPAPHQSVSLT